MDFKTLNFKAAGEGLSENQFAGYANTWDYDSDGDLMQRGAFAKTLASFLDDGFIAWQHQWDAPIGKPIEAREDERGLFIKAQISDVQQGRDAMTLIKDGVVKKLSIGFEVEGFEVLSDERGTEVMGEEAYNAAKAALPWYRDGVRLITQVKLFEVSPVSVPANNQSNILAAKSSGFELSLAEHSDAVVSAVRGLLERTRQKAALRKAHGRALSEAQRSSITAVLAEIDAYGSDLRGVLDAFMPEEIKSISQRDLLDLEQIRHRANLRAIGATA